MFFIAISRTDGSNPILGNDATIINFKLCDGSDQESICSILASVQVYETCKIDFLQLEPSGGLFSPTHRFVRCLGDGTLAAVGAVGNTTDDAGYVRMVSIS